VAARKRGALMAALDRRAKRAFDVAVGSLAFVLLIPLILVVALAIKVDSRGPVFYRSRRIGCRSREFPMLKFRKMRADAAGPALTAVGDERFTRIGRLLAASKIDEIPQLWNVLKGDMSLVGPRPEDLVFVRLHEREYAEILRVKPGITGLSQVAFARESEILDPDRRIDDYVTRLLPQKLSLDRLYVSRRSMASDLRILFWTIVVVVFRRRVAVHRVTGKLNLRRRPSVLASTPIQ
jgi:lipopolysaccharide/colanic/teichoic acid biosynthesis glycosyltransferase